MLAALAPYRIKDARYEAPPIDLEMVRIPQFIGQGNEIGGLIAFRQTDHGVKDLSVGVSIEVVPLRISMTR